MTSMIYAGIGSRKAPIEILAKMQSSAKRLAEIGWTLRSGAAAGADTAFEDGCKVAQGRSEIWLPWSGFNNHEDTGLYPTKGHMTLAATVHPSWSRLTEGPRKLHARNMGQVLGRELDAPVSFVLCWTPDGCQTEAERTRDTGGTGSAIVLADRNNIPVFNLARPDAYERFADHVRRSGRKFHADGTSPAAADGNIFVFGSNLSGTHGAGAAKAAHVHFGAIMGCGTGAYGNSYAIPTKDRYIETMPLEAIKEHVNSFIEYAKRNPQKEFFVTAIGCGLAGYSHADIAPMFLKAPVNCSFPQPWEQWLGVQCKPTIVAEQVAFQEALFA